MPNFHPALRRILFIINLTDVSKTDLRNGRKVSNFFSRLTNFLWGYKYPDFYKVVKAAAPSPEGHEIPVKIFIPAASDQPLPVFMYYHGGGFAYGTYDTKPNFCKSIAVKANCIVVSVDYRLAPEHPFPAAINDCYHATQWVAQHIADYGGDGTRIAVGGESAGGNLAACVSVLARDKGTPAILHQTLLYPAVDMTMTEPSIEKNGKGYMLTKPLIEKFRKAYVPDEAQRSNPYCSPTFADLKNLPPALVLTAEYDPLVDEGNKYAAKLKAAGVAVRHKQFNDTIHDFTLIMPRVLPEAIESLEMMIEELRKAFAK